MSTPPFEILLALAEPVLAAIRIASSPDVHPEAARTLLDGQFRDLRATAERLRLPAKDVDDVVYALAAYADEVMLARPGTREAWLPRLIQLALFGENTAGDGFFVRLEALRRDGSRGPALLVYDVVLSLGFRGRYAGRDAERLALIESVHLDLVRAGADTERVLAPHAMPKRPRGRTSFDSRWALAIAALTCVLAVSAWAVLALDLSMHAATVLGPG